jgi:CRP-like cAMP-binding protein
VIRGGEREKTLITKNLLRDYPLFTGLSEAEFSNLASCMSRRTFAKNAYIYYPGNPGLNMYLVESGLVRLFFTNARGEEFIMDLIGPHHIVGFPLLPDDQIRLAGAAAQLTSMVLVLSWEDVSHFMKSSPQFMRNISLETISCVKRQMLHIQSLTCISLNGRLANLLLFLSTNGKNQETRKEIDLPLNQTEMASWLGASRGRLNRVLSRMQNLGLIYVDGQKINILDRQGLERMTEGLLFDQL